MLSMSFFHVSETFIAWYLFSHKICSAGQSIFTRFIKPGSSFASQRTVYWFGCSTKKFCSQQSRNILELYKTMLYVLIRKPGWKVCQLRTECQETDKILRTKNEITVRTKIQTEIARDGPIPIFYDNVL